MSIVTISREVGAGGSNVAAMLGERLGCEVIDRWIVAEIARRLELSEQAVESADEHAITVVDRLLDVLKFVAPPGVWVVPRPDAPGDPTRTIPNLTEELIREVARMGSAVIVGRGAAFILADYPDTLHVFLRAPETYRLGSVVDRYRLDEQAATRRMHAIDAERAAYIRQMHDADWRNPARHDLVINTARAGIGGAVDLILTGLHSGGQVRSIDAARRK